MTYLSTLAQATSNAIKAAHSEFYKNLADSQSHASINPQMPFNNPKCPIPMRMKILNELLSQTTKGYHGFSAHFALGVLV